MKVSLRVYYFNGECYTLAIHECGCVDMSGHPGPGATRQLHIPSIEDSLAVAIQRLDGVRQAYYVNGMLLVIVQAGVDFTEIEQRITAVLMAVSEPEYTLDALLKAGAESFNRVPEHRRVMNRHENYEGILFNPRKDSWGFDDRVYLGRRGKGREIEY